MKNRHYSYSTLSIPCEVALQKKLRGRTKEGVVAEATEAGTEIHRLLANHLWEAVVELGYPDPTEWRELVEKERVEQETEFEFGIEGYTITGRRDGVVKGKNRVLVYEIKNQQSYEIQKHKNQLRLYALPYLREFLEVETKIYLPRYDQFLPVESLDFSDIEKIEKWIISRIKHCEEVLEMENPRKEASWYCEYCSYLFSCDTPAEAKIPVTEEDAQEMGKALIIMEAQRKGYMRVLKQWVEKHKNVIVEDKEIGYHRPQSLSIDAYSLLDWCEENEIDPITLFSPKINAFKKACKDAPELTNLGHYIEGKPEFRIRNKEGI